MGDVARSVPVLVALRDAYPNARIDWLVQDTFADVVRAHPALSRALPFPRREFSRWATTGRWASLVTYLRGFARERYDLVIDAQGLARSGLIARCTGAPRRIGHADARELGWLGYTSRVPSDPEMHTVERMLSLVRSLGIPASASPRTLRLFTPAEGSGFASSFPALAGRRYAVLAPTSRWVSKQWPDERFASLARSLTAGGFAVAFVGAASERAQAPACTALARENPDVIDLLGSTSVAQLMDVIEHAALVVGNDSAAVHIAVGFARPLVGLYGPTRLHRVGPCGRAPDALQHVRSSDRFEHKDPRTRVLMERITLPEVVEACRVRLGR